MTAKRYIGLPQLDCVSERRGRARDPREASEIKTSDLQSVMRVQDFRFGYLNLLLFCRRRCRRRHGRCLSYLTVDARTNRGEK